MIASNTPRHRKTKRAAADYADILRYTRKRWGDEQFTAYRALLDNAINAVGDKPDRLNSHNRDELKPGARSFHIDLIATRPAQGRHVVYYRVASDGIVEILRILHDRMEVSSKVR